MLVVRISSFGFIRSGLPDDESGHGGGFVFDCRFLPNPGRHPTFALKNGMDSDVIEFLDNSPQVESFFSSVKSIVDLAVREYEIRDFGHLSVAFGCTGGQHRSVYFAERLARELIAGDVMVKVEHTEQGKWW